MNNCTKCNQKLRIENEIVGENKSKNKIFVHNIGYCDTCMFKFDLGYSETKKANISFYNFNTNTNDFDNYKQPKVKKKDSVGSIIAALLSLFTFTYIIGFVIAIMDFLLNDKTKRHLGSWFAIIMSIIFFIFGIGFENNTKDDNKYYINNNENATTNITENQTTNKSIQVGETIKYNGLSIVINELDLNYTKDMPELNDGTKYIYLSFTITNNTESDIFVNIYDFDCYADNTYCEPNFHIDHKSTSATLSKDRNVSLCVSYYVPVDSKEIEIEFEYDIWNNEKLILKLQ